MPDISAGPEMCVNYIQPNIFILDLNPIIKWSLRANHFYKLTKTYFVKKSMLLIEFLFFFTKMF